jgi:hypothetical protein
LFDHWQSQIVGLAFKYVTNASPTQVWTGPEGSRRLPEFLDNRKTKVVKMTALSTGRINPPGNILLLISVRV